MQKKKSKVELSLIENVYVCVASEHFSDRRVKKKPKNK